MMIAAMTDLEMWTFCCIVAVFVSLVSYGIILVKDQMIIQVVKVRVGICKFFEISICVYFVTWSLWSQIEQFFFSFES